MTNEELRKLSSADLLKKIEESKAELFNLRFNQAKGNLEKPSRIRELRTLVARELRDDYMKIVSLAKEVL